MLNTGRQRHLYEAELRIILKNKGFDFLSAGIIRLKGEKGVPTG